MSTTALVLGVPTVHCFAHAVRSATALGFPTTADRVFGRYFSVQSGDTLNVMAESHIIMRTTEGHPMRDKVEGKNKVYK